MLRLGLCCLFREAPIKFRSTTAKSLLRLARGAQLERLDQLCLDNSRSLVAALDEVHRLDIGAFRVLSSLFPLYTHPDVGYCLDDLPHAAEIKALLAEAKRRKEDYHLRLSFHPDQFVLLSSPRPEITAASLQELDYQATLAELLSADVINIHAGGVYGDKVAALDRLQQQIEILPPPIRQRLTLENDDQSYTVADLIPLCRDTGTPLVYDVHHHRCNPDGLSIAQATTACIDSWEQVGREPYFHISSPKYGWGKNPKPHSDFIDTDDFPEPWKDLQATVDVEAKAKEPAVLQLKKYLESSGYDQKGAHHG